MGCIHQDLQDRSTPADVIVLVDSKAHRIHSSWTSADYEELAGGQQSPIHPLRPFFSNVMWAHNGKHLGVLGAQQDMYIMTFHNV